ncbi:hypothetical protein ACIPZ8_23735 [Pseudomonas sp. NPDC089422]|uniref:hypothetical protein n=1 Tax=Pseudomonas sp. NPDC089422 TaxID=3364466 RepID=UPI0038016BB3
MQNQNRDQAEQLIAEVLAAAFSMAEEDGGSAEDRSLVRRVLQCTEEVLSAQRISVHSQAGVAGKVRMPTPRSCQIDD